MSVQTEIDRIIGLVGDSHAKVAAKGGTTAAPYLLANLPAAIESIPDASDPVLQTKTVTPSTSQQNVTPDSGYDGLAKVTVNAMPTATQATPSISVSSGGLITASATQSAGYVAKGTKSATKQLTTQAAQTITPGTTDKTIASGRYLTGTQTIKGDANLVAGNIKLGVSIFGVDGSYEGSGGGSGSGGSVEMCTVSVDTSNLANIDLMIFATNDTGLVKIHKTIPQYGGTVDDILVYKNSVVAINGAPQGIETMTGDVEMLAFIGPCKVFGVRDDCTIIYSAF